MQIGYARVSNTDGSQSLDLQRDALRAEGIDGPANLYHDFASGVRDDRPGLNSCLRALRKGDVLVVWKLDLSATIPQERNDSSSLNSWDGNAAKMLRARW